MAFGNSWELKMSKVIVCHSVLSQMLNVDKDVDNVFLQTGRRLEEAANGEVGKELGKVEFFVI